jgi:UDP-glucose 4-epimerase
VRILITGGAGFIGSHLVNALVQSGKDEIVVLDDLSRGNETSLRACTNHITFVRESICDRKAIMDATAGADLVFHLAAQSNVMGAVTDLDGSFATNVIGTYNVLSCAWKCGVRRMIFTSSREVYGETPVLPVGEDAPIQPKNAYGASKAAGEVYARVFGSLGLDIVVFRLSNVYGPGDRGRVIPLFLEAALADQPLLLYGGQQIIDFVWIDEVVRVLISASRMARTEEPVNIGSGCGVTVRELAERIIKLTGSRSTLNFVPARSVEVSRFVADVRRAQALLELTVPPDPLFGLDQILAGIGKTIRSGS